MRVLAVVPARGGSKGVPKKNIRFMAGKPLIGWIIEAALRSRHEISVVVSSDDEEILMFAERFGARVLRRSPELARDATTLDPVIHDAFVQMAHAGPFDVVATFQPTSPLLTTRSIDEALQRMEDEPGLDTLISGVDDTHLTWRREEGRFFPNYAARVNRQQLPKVYKETGGFFLTRPQFVTAGSRLGTNVSIFELPVRESVDIDSYEDWNLCELQLNRRKVLFVILGSRELGLGHAYRALLLAQELPDHDVEFLAIRGAELAQEAVQAAHYQCRIQETDDLAAEILSLGPHLVVNDILDTDEAYIAALKAGGVGVVNFEDLGSGIKVADAVFNALYPERFLGAKVYSGYEYFCVRDEFMVAGGGQVREHIEEVLITFGGTDPQNLTRKTLEALHAVCRRDGIKITVVLGLGYGHSESLGSWEGVEIHQNTKRISDFMARADLIFTSAGRTVYEIASLGVPAIVLAQNERELTHYFAHPENGFINLGEGKNVSPQELTDLFVSLASRPDERRTMHARMREKNLRLGKKRVIDIIRTILKE